MPWKFHDDMSNGSRVIVLTDIKQTQTNTNEKYCPRYAKLCGDNKGK